MKRIYKLAITLTAFTFIFAACGKKNTNKKSADQPKTKQVETKKDDKKDDKKESKNKADKKEDTKAKSVNVDEYVKTIGQKVAKNWPHMEKIWPKLNYKDHQIVLFYHDKNMNIQKAWLINTKEVKELKAEEYKGIQAPIIGGFNKTEFSGKQSIVMSINEDSIKNEYEKDSVYTLATHELVHFYHQHHDHEDYVEGGNGLAQSYPINSEPRLYRTMMYRNLYNFINEGKFTKDNANLQKAAYWFNKWKTEYPEELKATRDADIYEGHARYIEYYGSKVGEAKELDPKPFLNPDMIFTNSSLESYELGFLSGAVLDKIKPEWKENFLKNKKSATELLFEGVKEMKDENFKDVKDRLDKELSGINKNLEASIKNILDAEKNTKIPYLKISQKYIQGSIESEGFYNYKENEIMKNLTTVLSINGKEFNINGLNVLSDGSNLIIPMADKYEVKNDELHFNNKHLKGVVKFTKTTDKTGREIYEVK